MFRRVQVLIVLSIGLAMAAPAHANVINLPESVFDTSTRLRWLDLSISHELSFNEIGTLIGPGRPYGDYDVASADEVVGLLGNMGLPVPDFAYFQQPGWLPWERDISFAEANRFIDLFGQTGLVGFPPPFRASAGVFQVEFGNPLNVFMYEVMAGPLDGGGNIGRVRAGFTGAQATGGFGVFVNRPINVPEPGAFLLFALASPCACRVLRRRRHHRISTGFLS